MHILLLQLLYSVPSEQQLYEQLNYNLLFRWFVGLGLNQKVWSFKVLSRDIATLLNEPRAVLLIQNHWRSVLRCLAANARVLLELRAAAHLARQAQRCPSTVSN
jgi:transposase